MPLGFRNKDNSKLGFQKGNQINKGRKRSKKQKVQISKFFKGRKLSESHKAKLSGSNNPNWKGGRQLNKVYIEVLSPHHPHRTRYGMVLEHRLIMEAHLKRYLTPKEVVHHENGITTDNRLENLKLFSNGGGHTSYHAKLKSKRKRMHRYICEICEVVKSKSTCDRSRVGATIINKDHEIISTGYNSSPRGFDSCKYAGHIMKNGHCIATVHAEVNAISQSAKNGWSCNNAIMYVTYVPCFSCTQLLIQVGIKKVYAKQIRYTEGYDLMKKAGIEVFDWNEKPFDRDTKKT